jgi:hypothetical protein
MLEARRKPGGSLEEAWRRPGGGQEFPGFQDSELW